MSVPVLMQGSRACVEGAIRAGLKFFAGYPITPSTEIAELASIRMPEVKGKFIQMEDEISSISAVLGASSAGLKSMTATSGPGFSLKQEVIGYAFMCEIPCVIVDVMRGGPSTGLPTCVSQGDVMQAKWGTHGDHAAIVLAPSTVSDIYYLTIKAFNYAEKYRTPVILLLDAANAHIREKVELDDDVEIIDRKKPLFIDNYMPYKADKDFIPPMANLGEGYNIHITGLFHDEDGFPTNRPDLIENLSKRLFNKINMDKDNIVLYKTENIKGCKRLIIAYGSTARAARQVIEDYKYENIGLFIPYTLWPFPHEKLVEIINENKIESIYVCEMNEGQLLLEIQRHAKKRCSVSGINKYSGILFTPDEIIDSIRRGENE